MPDVETLAFLGRRAENEDVYGRLPAAAAAALRQFSAERLIGYGVDPADTVELRAGVIDGGDWQAQATRLADAVLARAVGGSTPTRIAGLRRASALLRMSQILLLSDTDERRATFARAATLFGEAAALSGDADPMLIDTKVGPLAGWLYRARGPALGSAIIIGGVEGWAMDFSSEAEALAARGIDALMLDGPGQGESRFAHGHMLHPRWPEAYAGAIDHMAARAPGHRLALVGNSLGGSIAMTLAAADRRIALCCANGAIAGLIAPPGAGSAPALDLHSVLFAKVLAACGTSDRAIAQAAWRRIDPLAPGDNPYALLLLHGGNDLAIPADAAETLLDRAPTGDKHMIVFSDGDHCLYNHRSDRDALIADWVCARFKNINKG